MQNKFKKIVATLLSAITVFSGVATFTGCVGGDTTPETSKVVTGDVEVVAYDGSEVSITFYHTMGQKLRAVLDKYIPKFNAIYPNIHVYHASYNDYPGLRDQISKELTSYKAPSVAFCYPDHVALYNNANTVLPMDSFIESKLDVTIDGKTTETMGFTQAQLDDFVPAYYAEGAVYGDGKMYTLPFAKSSEVLYYNKKYFTENNYQVPTTWDEMATLCKTILENDPDAQNVVPLGYDSEANWFITMCEQLQSPYTTATKGEYFKFDNETNWNFVQKFRGWYREGYVTTEEIYGSYTSDLFKQTNKKLLHSYMTIGSSAGASYQCPNKIDGTDKYPFEVGVAMIPQENENNQKVISQGPSLCLFKKENPQEMAATWLFTKFLTSNIELQADYSMASGYAPAIQSVENDELYQEFLATADGNVNLQASCVKLTTSAEYKAASFISPAFNGSSMARDQVGILIQNAFLNSPKAGQTELEFIQDQFDTALERLYYYYGA